MKAFGLELRKADQRDVLTQLYEQVDQVIETQCSDIERQAVAHALQNMINGGKWFDVCTIKDCRDVASIVIPDERMNIYRAAHCIHWSSMTSEYRQNLVAMVLDDFRELLNPQPQSETPALYEKEEETK